MNIILLNIKEAVNYLKFQKGFKTQKAIANELGYKATNFSSALNGDERYLTDNFVEKFCSTFNINKNWLQTGEGKMLKSDLKKYSEEPIREMVIEEATIPDEEVFENKNGNSFIDLGGGFKLMTMPLLEIEAQAGFVDNLQDTEFLTSIEDKHSIIVSDNHLGRYVALRVKGDSMDDNTGEAIRPNSIVSCRELQRHLWRDKLKTNKYPYWVIATTKSSYPLLKEIVNHDVEKGILTCHSLNDAPEYQDFELHLNDVTALFYVVDVNRTISNKPY